MENSTLAQIFYILKFLLPLVVGISVAIFGLITGQIWLSFAAIMSGIIGQIIAFSILPSDN